MAAYADVRAPRGRDRSLACGRTLSGSPDTKPTVREHRPPTLIVWGPRDGYMPEGSARAYLGDRPDAELHLLDGGHWALETNLGEVVTLVRDFLGRVHSSVR
jgi:pimeloyl-ACP methyl ester carboxylesterase